MNEFINILNVITTLRNNNVKPWCVCTRWITKTIVGSMYIWKWVICVQIDECYFIISLFIQLNRWFKPCFESSFIIAHYNWKRSLWFCNIFSICLRRFSILWRENNNRFYFKLNLVCKTRQAHFYIYRCVFFWLLRSIITNPCCFCQAALHSFLNSS